MRGHAARSQADGLLRAAAVRVFARAWLMHTAADSLAAPDTDARLDRAGVTLTVRRSP